MQFALFGLITAILALKRPYLTLDHWVQRSPHERSLSPAMWTGDRLNVGLLDRGGFFPRSNQFCHASPSRTQPLRLEIRHRVLACLLAAQFTSGRRVIASAVLVAGR